MIESKLMQSRQIVILSHYFLFLENFFKRLHGQTVGITLAKLYQDATGSNIRIAAVQDFIETSHQRAYRRISGFINREHQEDIFLDLRVFFESEVKSRYYKAICDNNFGNLQFSVLLTELVRVAAMTESKRQVIDPLRITLNADHHDWIIRTAEEKRGLAEEVLVLIYSQL